MYNKLMKKVFLLSMLFILSVWVAGPSYSQEMNNSDTVLSDGSPVEGLTLSDNVVIHEEKVEPLIESEKVSEDESEVVVEDVLENKSGFIESEEAVDESEAIFLDVQNTANEQKIFIKETISSEDMQKEFLSKPDKTYIPGTDNSEYTLNTNLYLKNDNKNESSHNAPNASDVKVYSGENENTGNKNFLSKTVTKKSLDIKFGVDNKRFIP